VASDDGVSAARDPVEGSLLFEGLYSHGVPCFTQFAQFGFCSSHCHGQFAHKGDVRATDLDMTLSAWQATVSRLLMWLARLDLIHCRGSRTMTKLSTKDKGVLIG
jgi:hypothetical protein